MDVDPDPMGSSAGSTTFGHDMTPEELAQEADNAKRLVREKTPPTERYDDSKELDDLMSRIQSKIKRRRIDIKAIFAQFDPLNCGRIAPNRFRSSLKTSNLISLNDTETDLLCKAFKSTKGSDPDKVEYARFCVELDKVFTDNKLHLNPLSNPVKFKPVSEGFEDVSARGQGLPLNDTEALVKVTDPIIAKMRDICYTRRMNSKQFFTQHDRHKTGCVTVGKFEAIMKGSLGFQLGKEDWSNLVNRFRRDATHVKYFDLARMLNEEPDFSTANQMAKLHHDPVLLKDAAATEKK
jgi:Ca2+-binding EF-hand superfamily protein